MSNKEKQLRDQICDIGKRIYDIREIVKRSCSILEYYPENSEYYEGVYQEFELV